LTMPIEMSAAIVGGLISGVTVIIGIVLAEYLTRRRDSWARFQSLAIDFARETAEYKVAWERDNKRAQVSALGAMSTTADKMELFTRRYRFGKPGRTRAIVIKARNEVAATRFWAETGQEALLIDDPSTITWHKDLVSAAFGSQVLGPDDITDTVEEVLGPADPREGGETIAAPVGESPPTPPGSLP
jgi:hypothetical protein